MNSDFNARDAAGYDSVAGAFDRLSAVYTAPFAEELVERAEVGLADRVLDLGAGTGVVSRRVITRGAMCVAADLSEGMLRVAERKKPGLQPVVMDAETPCLVSGSFSRIVSLFAVSHFTDPGAVLRQCATLLEPGGVLIFGFGSGAPTAAALREAPRHISDFIRLKRGVLLKAPMALDEFIRAEVEEQTDERDRSVLNRRNSLKAITRDAGFTSVETGWLGRRFVVESAEEFWELQRVFSSYSRTQLARMATHERERVQREFCERAEDVSGRGGQLVYDVGATWVLGRRPT